MKQCDAELHWHKNDLGRCVRSNRAHASFGLYSYGEHVRCRWHTSPSRRCKMRLGCLPWGYQSWKYQGSVGQSTRFVSSRLGPPLFRNVCSGAASSVASIRSQAVCEFFIESSLAILERLPPRMACVYQSDEHNPAFENDHTTFVKDVARCASASDASATDWLQNDHTWCSNVTCTL